MSRAPRILPDIRKLIDSARQRVAATANLSMVELYWNIGRIITQDILKNRKRAEYGEELVDALGRHLTAEYSQSFSARNLWDMKRFFADFNILQAAPAESRKPIGIDFKKHYHLGWTH